MKKLLLLTFLVFTLSLKPQISWADLEDSLTIFSEKNNNLIGYSPLFGAIALQSNIIKNDWLKANHAREKNRLTDNPLVLLLFNYREGESSINISRFNNDILLHLTPLLIAKLVVALEGDEETWESFKKEYGKTWEKELNPSRFSKKVDLLYDAYTAFCINDKNKQKAREYFSALLCLLATTKAAIQEYLMNIDTLNLTPATSLQKINPDYQEYEKQTIHLLTNTIKNLYVPDIKLWNISMCMEQTIATLINVLFYDHKNDRLTINTIPKDIQRTVSPQLQDYITKFSDPKSAYDQEKKEALISLFINIPEVDYIQKHESLNNNNVEADTTPKNLILILNHLFGTQEDSFKKFLNLFTTTHFSEKRNENKNIISYSYSFTTNKILASIKLDSVHAYFKLKTFSSITNEEDNEEDEDDEEDNEEDEDDEEDNEEDEDDDDELDDGKKIDQLKIISLLTNNIKAPQNPLFIVDRLIEYAIENLKNDHDILNILIDDSITNTHESKTKILNYLFQNNYDSQFIQKIFNKHQPITDGNFELINFALNNKFLEKDIFNIIKSSNLIRQPQLMRRWTRMIDTAVQNNYSLELVQQLIIMTRCTMNLDVIYGALIKRKHDKQSFYYNFLIQNQPPTEKIVSFLEKYKPEEFNENGESSLHQLFKHITEFNLIEQKIILTFIINYYPDLIDTLAYKEYTPLDYASLIDDCPAETKEILTNHGALTGQELKEATSELPT